MHLGVAQTFGLDGVQYGLWLSAKVKGCVAHKRFLFTGEAASHLAEGGVWAAGAVLIGSGLEDGPRWLVAVPKKISLDPYSEAVLANLRILRRESKTRLLFLTK